MAKGDTEMRQELDDLASELQATYAPRFANTAANLQVHRYSSPRLSHVVWGIGVSLETEHVYDHIDIDMATRPRLGGRWKLLMPWEQARRALEDQISAWSSPERGSTPS